MSHAPLVVACTLVLVIAGLTGCSGADAEARSMLGADLRAPDLSAEDLATYQAELDEAAAVARLAPDDESAIIWLGRRQAYLGRYRDAIETFSRGLEQFPDSYRLRRHRGHRYLTTRNIAAATRDLEDAVILIDSVADAVEPDGRPNRLNLPRSSTHTNIWYHLALAYYIDGAWIAARDAWSSCLAFAQNDDMLVAAAYWRVLAAYRAGDEDTAIETLAMIRPEMDVIENDGYHRLLLLYQGHLTIDDFNQPDDDAVQSATVAYGLARWHAMRGDHDAERDALEAIVAGPMWPAFGHLAAEADLAGR